MKSKVKKNTVKTTVTMSSKPRVRKGSKHRQAVLASVPESNPGVTKEISVLVGHQEEGQ